MAFNSYEFLIFLPIVFVLYWIVPKKFQWFIILIASYYFYMRWNVAYSLLILSVTAISYVAAIGIDKYNDKKKPIVSITIVMLVLCLGFFKYFNFLSDTIYNIAKCLDLNMSHIILNVVLPVGISFYVFQSISYVIDVYRGEVKTEYHFGKYAAFVSFFPQLVAGPIERTNNLFSQIKNPREFNYDQAVYGLRLALWGFFKKIVIADNVSSLVDGVYNNITAYQGGVFICATFLFGIQIYCDFSGYSDIARGVAKLFGIDLMINFKCPYFSKSVKEFWNRWHISLSTWFRDYIYISLGGNRKGSLRTFVNLIITFAISGLWHGAKWTFVIWGLLHGIFQIAERIAANPKSKAKIVKVVQVFLTYVVVNIAWIFFRADNIHDAWYIIKNMIVGIGSKKYCANMISDLNVSNKTLCILSFSLLILILYDYLSLKKDVIKEMNRMSTSMRWIYYFVFIAILILLMPIKETTQFVYFQF